VRGLGRGNGATRSLGVGVFVNRFYWTGRRAPAAPGNGREREVPKITEHVFVVGPDALNQRRLKQIDIRAPIAVHPVFNEKEIKDQASY
jgi:hypothetical protein